MSGNYDFFVRAALGQDGLGAINKFGYNETVGTSFETVWSEGGLYVYPATALAMTASSSSANDALAGSGAKQIEIMGLDTDYVEQTIVIDMNGQNAVAITPSLLRVNRMKVLGDQDAEGDIYVGNGTVTAGVPANVYSKVDLGEDQTLQAVFTVPAGKMALLFFWSATSSRLEEVNVVLKAREFGGVLQTKDKIDVFQNTVPQAYPVPIVFPPKTDIEIRAKSATSTSMVSGKFSMVLIPEQ